jgi:GalNAc-alpha-(1->4)-GalNAc-alpha-(1->3)-diNAcBac-PP-undecaprenol alpha-1,4-N-acetyl-D-galactosaminyltransferase
MKKGKIVSLFYLNKDFAGKDMFLTPKYLSDYLGFQGEIVYPKGEENLEFKNEYRGIKLTPIYSLSNYYSTFWSEKEMAWWLIKNARKIDVLCLFWLNHRNLIFAKIYKILNPRGICYIKGDLGYIDFSKIVKKGVKNNLRTFFFKAVDVFSVETEDNYKAIINGGFGDYLSGITVLMTNGFDVELLENLNLKKRKFCDKENLLITVARIGHKDKNNEMMLAALDGVDMGDWKFILVGNVEEGFYKIYNDFIKRNPDKNQKVILSGGIYDRNELWEIYNKAKVFLLTSPKEGMANVFSEAITFGNYIITTNVSGAKEISDNERLGKVIRIGDVDALRNALCNIFDAKVDLETNYNEAIKLSDSKFNWRKLVEVVGDKINGIKKNRKF